MENAQWKPSKVQYLLARGFRRSTCATATIIAAVTAWKLLPALSLLGDFSFLFWYIASIVLVWALGWFAGAFFVWPFVSSLANKMNGAPFREGDRVRILTGPHRDRIVRVYDDWSPRTQARVELDDEARQTVTDVFDYTDICRERSA